MKAEAAQPVHIAQDSKSFNLRLRSPLGIPLLALCDPVTHNR